MQQKGNEQREPSRDRGIGAVMTGLMAAIPQHLKMSPMKSG